MVLRNESYTVSIQTEFKPAMDGLDLVYDPEDLLCSVDYYSARILRIEDSKGQSVTLALLGIALPDSEPCAVLEEEVLTVILFDSIVRLDLKSGQIIRNVKCENMGGLMEIHPIPEGYILYGEGDIFRYDRSLNQIWRRGARDILASPAGEKAFWIENSLIHYRDWEGWHYTLDFEGNRLGEIQENVPSQLTK